jgi:hypothetical protein
MVIPWAIRRLSLGPVSRQLLGMLSYVLEQDCGPLGLARTSARTLDRYDRTPHQQLTAPHAARLRTIQRTGQARDPGPAPPEHLLRLLHIPRRLRKEQPWILPAGKIESGRKRDHRADQHQLIRPGPLPDLTGPAGDRLM